MATSSDLKWFVNWVILLLFINASLNFHLVFCDRNVTTQFNPGCNLTECMPDYPGSVANVAYIKAEGMKDTLHYLLSSIGAPTVLVLMTDTSKDVPHIDWEKLLQKNGTGSIAGAVIYPASVKYSYAVVFTKLFEYNDMDDTADMTFDQNITHGKTHYFSDFIWDYVGNFSTLHNNNIVFNTSLSMMSDKETMNGSLSFSFTIYSHTDRTMDMPHLLYNDNITQFDFIIDHMEPMYSKSRFGIEAALISSDPSKDMDSKFEMPKSIDDEYTPGVFKVTNWFTNAAETDHEGYVQWKPVCYMSANRTRGDGTYVKTYTISDVMMDKSNMSSWGILQTSVAYAYYGEKLNDTAGVKMANISFGLSKDGWYTKTNYTVWTGNIGYGTPPVDSISMLVIGIISAGLGIPVIVIIFGGVFVCIKKQKDKKTRELGVIN